MRNSTPIVDSLGESAELNTVAHRHLARLAARPRGSHTGHKHSKNPDSHTSVTDMVKSIKVKNPDYAVARLYRWSTRH